MIIQSIQSGLYRVPPSTPWVDAAVTVSGIELVLVEVKTEEGETGTGLAYTVGPGGSAVMALINECAPFLVGQYVLNYQGIEESLRRSMHRLGHGGLSSFAVAAIDIALWDTMAKSRKLPLFRALGAVHESVPVYESGIDLFLSPAELAESLGQQVEAGAKAIKIKVGRTSLREDVARLAAAREAIGQDMPLLLDANQCWNLPEALRRLQAFEPFHPYWIEEPLSPEDVSGHARLRRASSIPVAVGESLYTSHQFRRYLETEAADILQPDVVRVGGITEFLKIAHLCEAWHCKVAPHFMSEISVHLLCAIPNGLFLENVRGGTLKDLGLTAVSIIQDGLGIPPEDHGIGFQLDFSKLAQFAVDSL